jgi:AcrR family transcriptional regulator
MPDFHRKFPLETSCIDSLALSSENIYTDNMEPSPESDAHEKTYHHGDLKNALIAAGIVCLEQDGLAALSLRAIAARAGVSHTAPKNHFGSLRGLLTAIATEAWHRHTAAMRGHLPANAPARDRLVAMADGYVRFATAHPAIYQLMLSPLHCDMSQADYRAAAGASYALLSAISADLIREGLAPFSDQRRVETMLWSLVHGYVALDHAGMLGGPPGSGAVPTMTDLLPLSPA